MAEFKDIEKITELRAQDLYAIYCASSGGKNYQGLPCPLWHELPENIRVNWRVVVRRSVQHGITGASSAPLEWVLEGCRLDAISIWRQYAQSKPE